MLEVIFHRNMQNTLRIALTNWDGFAATVISSNTNSKSNNQQAQKKQRNLNPPFIGSKQIKAKKIQSQWNATTAKSSLIVLFFLPFYKFKR